MYTFPTKEEMEQFAQVQPDHRWPNRQPYAVILESYLSDEQCDEIIVSAFDLEEYHHRGCGAITREFDRPIPPCLRTMSRAMLEINSKHWDYILDWTSLTAWMQTYSSGGDYQSHTDDGPGESRKLTGVLLLSSPDQYEGGSLVLNGAHNDLSIRPPRGSIVIFPGTLQHEVTEIIHGMRMTINLGVWGPPLR